MKANQLSLKSIRNDEHGYAAVIGAIVAIMLTIMVCIMIYWKLSTPLSEALGTGAVGVAAHKLTNNTNTTANSIFTLAPIVGIVLIAGVILGIVMRFGAGKEV